MNKLTLLYDGNCVVCDKEVQHYLRLDKQEFIIPINIASNTFSASDYGLVDEDVNLHMHAIEEDGTVYKGVDTFVAIWKRIPKYKFLIPVFENKLLRPTIDLGYDFFAKHIRKRLPKKNCDNGACTI